MTLYVPLLKSCSTKGPLLQIHAHLLTTGLHRDPLLATKLIESYAKMGSSGEARLVFDEYRKPDAFMWGVMIKSHVWSLQFKEAISLYHHGMHYYQFQLSNFIFPPVLKACSSLYDVAMGRKMHGMVIKAGFESDTVVETSLLQMYGERGNLEDAQRVFDEMPMRDVVSWSSMVSISVQCGQAVRGLHLFSQMIFGNIVPDSVMMLKVVEACADMGFLRLAKSVHGYILKRWVVGSDELPENSLISMYSKCDDLDSAEKLFKNASWASVVSWTAMIASYNQRCYYREALCSCIQMTKSEVEPNSVTMMGILHACTQLGLLREGKSVHGFSIRRGIDPHLNFVGTTLITMYSSFGNLWNCFRVFEATEEKTIVLWNSLISACSRNGCSENALMLFVHMRRKGLFPDSFTLASTLPACGHVGELYLGRQFHGIVLKTGLSFSNVVQNSLIHMYCKCRSIDAAFMVFDEMKEKDVITWNTMIHGFSQNSRSEEAISLFDQMHYQGLEMDAITFLCGTKACSNLGSLAKGRWIQHKLITSGLKKDTRIETALTDMYAKCGDIEMARRVFDCISEKNVIAWSSIIAGYGIYGLADEAISLFSRMIASGIRPNEVTFMGMLTACSHAGLVEEGLFYFDSMREGYGIEPQLDHYVSVVDLLSRAGHISRAIDFIESMRVDPNDSIWRALLNGCHIHQKKDLVDDIQMRIVRMTHRNGKQSF